MKIGDYVTIYRIAGLINDSNHNLSECHLIANSGRTGKLVGIVDMIAIILWDKQEWDIKSDDDHWSTREIKSGGKRVVESFESRIHTDYIMVDKQRSRQEILNNLVD
jgi:hypothetical protein